jgi:hypothetical protein
MEVSYWFYFKEFFREKSTKCSLKLCMISREKRLSPQLQSLPGIKKWRAALTSSLFLVKLARKLARTPTSPKLLSSDITGPDLLQSTSARNQPNSAQLPLASFLLRLSKRKSLMTLPSVRGFSMSMTTRRSRKLGNSTIRSTENPRQTSQRLSLEDQTYMFQTLRLRPASQISRGPPKTSFPQTV